MDEAGGSHDEGSPLVCESPSDDGGRTGKQKRHTAMADVTTMFCDDKFNQQTTKCGIKPGQAYDLRTGYNINDPKVKDEIERNIRAEKPDLVVGSPMCGPFSQMNSINDQITEADIARKKTAIEHLKFTFEFLEIQMKNAKYVICGRPWSSESWKHDIIKEAEARFGMNICKLCQCYFATQEYTDRHGTTGLIKKPTGSMTNCPDISQKLNKMCTADHKHVGLFGGLSQKLQAYPEKLVQAVLRGLKNALRKKCPMSGLFAMKGDLRGVPKRHPEHYVIFFRKHEGC